MREVVGCDGGGWVVREDGGCDWGGFDSGRWK